MIKQDQENFDRLAADAVERGYVLNRQVGQTEIWSVRSSNKVKVEIKFPSSGPEYVMGYGLDDDDLDYLNESLDLYLDDMLVDSLRIGADLQGRAVTDIQISGSGFGATQPEAAMASGENMKGLQTVLITGSLPVKLDIVKTDNISPVLGKEFVNNAILVGVLAILAVAIIVFIKFKCIYISMNC